ncbi:NAD(P)H-dependent oxidoreductase [Mesorhizobium sp. M1A.F.Ca.IN.022.07.1.1]|uniref:NADPH-dependent FMN reductase n=6 Tax=Mesorhizobium TaxID=68287 RepID=UPI000BAF315E|nr:MULTISPECIES: NADPH-dependent FMN reductase [unclassified Mesorhizobium]TGV94539.1 NAD(P)H-dependent oxidoreductase [Mesorhizobium sp. M00.F.Ca.ET.158.01.1.1]WIE92197.1 NAD(P)H-dependent oxidoreductase [Mesorhizobium sp. WSM4875]AZO60357.1 NAD(P)H-dependent oxidoreductase [Mesorhizobium sp. M1A.F.Ca.IN.022.06.1.1]MCT2576100.1 NAD(P)H-dependent oxidoreductase [Mesorhizobium sp. P13.3]MDF3164968.1 NAD(P)H-dependent oxidoreductase [Mesorhizobium sp. P16.1]
MAVIARILVFAGSIRTGAFSGRTADVAQKELAMQGAEVTRISLGDYPLPIMDEDLEKDKGIPENAVKLGHQISAHDGLLIATPEYNGSIPPLLKNSIDWVSRLRRDGSRSFRPLYGKPVALCSSSEGKFAGIRCINHLRAVLVRCQMEVITPECSVSGADEAFAEDGQFRDARLHQSMERLCRTLIETSRMLSVRIEV